MQKLLQNANKLPQNDLLEQFVKSNPNIKEGILKCKRDLKKYVKDMVKIQKELFQVSETSIKIKVEEDEKDEEMYENLESNFKNLIPFVEETIDRWNSRTLLIKNMNSHHPNKAFGKTILDQVNSILNDEESKQKLLEKT